MGNSQLKVAYITNFAHATRHSNKVPVGLVK